MPLLLSGYAPIQTLGEPPPASAHLQLVGYAPNLALSPTWQPTNTLRWLQTKNDGPIILEQLWVMGTQTQWRNIPTVIH